MRQPTFLFVMLLISIHAVSAGNVVYIVSNPAQPDHNLINALQEIGFLVQVIGNENIGTIDWQEYDFMLIANNPFRNPDEFPVNHFPALILNTRYMNNWHWTSQISQRSASQPLSTYINDQNHIITQGMDGNVQIYTSSAATQHYLHRYYKHPDIRSVTSTSDATFWDTINAVIGTAEPGTNLRNGQTSTVKSVFFGIGQSQYWTPAAKQLFQRSAIWLTTDFYSPAYLEVEITEITNHSATISWKTDKPSTTSMILQGTEYNLSGYHREHTFDVSGLKEYTSYSFTLQGCNEEGYCGSSSPYTFTTADSTPPVILSQSLIDLTDSSVTISAAWNEPGFLKLFYGHGETLSAIERNIKAESGSIDLTDLNDKTEYRYIIQVCDESGNCANSTTHGFTTYDFTPPAMPKGFRLDVSRSGIYAIASWDEPADDATSWKVYIGNTPETIDLGNPIATVTEQNYTDLSPPKERYYIIRASDDAGNEENNTYVMGRYGVELGVGYNLVSLPLMPFEEDIASIMHQNNLYSPIAEIKRWNAETQSFEISEYLSGEWAGFQSLEYGRGYFFKTELPGVFLFTGIPPSDIVRRMHIGMNLIGSTTLGYQELTDIIVQSDGDIKASEISRRENDRRYTISRYIGMWENAFSIVPGAGYWLKAEQEFMI